MNVTSKISVDLTRQNVGQRVNAVQGDGNTREVEITLLAGGAPWTPPEGVEAAIAYMQPSGTKGMYNLLADGTAAISISGNVATVILAPQMLTASGTVQASLVFNDHQLNRLTTFPFSVQVVSNPAYGAQKTEDYICLQWLEDKLDEYLRKASENMEFVGPQGPKGDTGPQGPQGLQGPPGVSPTINQKGPDETGNVTLTSSDVGALAVSGGDVEGAINMNGQPISGLNDPTEDTQAARKGYVDAAKTAANAYTDASVRKAAPRNLLDNSDFRNPVNQRGKTSYADNGYTIDRFKQVDSTLTVSDGYINFATNADLAYKRLSQVLGYHLEANRPYTIAMYAKVNDVGSYGVFFRPATADGTGVSGLDGLRITDTTTDFTWYVYAFTPTDNTVQMCEILATKNEGSTVDVDIKYMCCYAGIYTAETLPEYQPKGYGAELAECQRYYYTIKSDGASFAAYASGTMNTASSAYFPILFPIPMRSIPTFYYSGSFRVYVNGGGRNVTDIGNNMTSRYSTRLSVGGISSGALGQACEFQSSSDGTAFIAFSADL